MGMFLRVKSMSRLEVRHTAMGQRRLRPFYVLFATLSSMPTWILCSLRTRRALCPSSYDYDAHRVYLPRTAHFHRRHAQDLAQHLTSLRCRPLLASKIMLASRSVANKT